MINRVSFNIKLKTIDGDEIPSNEAFIKEVISELSEDNYYNVQIAIVHNNTMMVYSNFKIKDFCFGCYSEKFSNCHTCDIQDFCHTKYREEHVFESVLEDMGVK